MEHTFSKLPSAGDALVPHISLQTMQYHYGKHQQGDVEYRNLRPKSVEAHLGHLVNWDFAAHEFA